MRKFHALLILATLIGVTGLHAEVAQPSAPPTWQNVVNKIAWQHTPDENVPWQMHFIPLDANTPGPTSDEGGAIAAKVKLTADKNEVITSMKVVVLWGKNNARYDFVVDHPTLEQIIPASREIIWSEKDHGFYFHFEGPAWTTGSNKPST